MPELWPAELLQHGVPLSGVGHVVVEALHHRVGDLVLHQLGNLRDIIQGDDSGWAGLGLLGV